MHAVKTMHMTLMMTSFKNSGIFYQNIFTIFILLIVCSRTVQNTKTFLQIFLEIEPFVLPTRIIVKLSK